MKKYITIILGTVLISIILAYVVFVSKIKHNNFKDLNRTQIQAEFDNIKEGMTINTVKNFLREESIVFKEDDYLEYIWIDLEDEVQIRVRLKNEEVIYKHISMHFSSGNTE